MRDGLRLGSITRLAVVTPPRRRELPLIVISPFLLASPPPLHRRYRKEENPVDSRVVGQVNVRVYRFFFKVIVDCLWDSELEIVERPYIFESIMRSTFFFILCFMFKALMRFHVTSEHLRCACY